MPQSTRRPYLYAMLRHRLLLMQWLIYSPGQVYLKNFSPTRVWSTGKLTKQMCELLGVPLIHTSPYHPQSNGILERWHACLKSMLKKVPTEKKDWDINLKYLLFSYADAPYNNWIFTIRVNLWSECSWSIERHQGCLDRRMNGDSQDPRLG